MDEFKNLSPPEVHKLLETFSAKMVDISVPVIITILICAYLTRVKEGSQGSTDFSRSISQTLNYSDAGISVKWAIVMAVAFVAVITVVTGILLLCYFYNCIKAIMVWMGVAVSLLLSYYFYLAMQDIPEMLNLTVDWISAAYLVFNMVVAGILSIFWRAPPIATQCFMVLISVLTALVFLTLPDWTIWVLLVLLVVYDALVVLCPNGLLIQIIKKSEERGDQIPALVYAAGDKNASKRKNRADEERDNYSRGASDAASEISEGSASGNKKNKRINDPDEGIRLGLGDFIFYSILITRAARIGWEVVILCSLAVVFGLSLTLLLLAWLNRPLPALPLSLILGIIFFLQGSSTFRPFVAILNENCVII